MYVLHKIEVAQAFDELSILEIKKAKRIDPEHKLALAKQICRLKTEINSSIGAELARQICYSSFYLDLYNANLQIFKYVDQQKWTEAAEWNIKRFESKKALQKNFFGENLEEIKI